MIQQQLDHGSIELSNVSRFHDGRKHETGLDRGLYLLARIGWRVGPQEKSARALHIGARRAILEVDEGWSPDALPVWVPRHRFATVPRPDEQRRPLLDAAGSYWTALLWRRRELNPAL